MLEARAVLLDIDGVLTVSWRPVPGALEALRAVRAAGIPFALLTNTTSRTRARIASTLAESGFEVSASDILTAPAVAAEYLRTQRPGRSVTVLNSGDVREDLAGVPLAGPGERPDVVLTGGAGDEYSYAALNEVFGHLQRGAELMAMNANLYWRTDEGLSLDNGAFLAGLERASGTRAVVLGKPAAEFFSTALDRVGVTAPETVMVGDDVVSDVLGAQAQGITGVLVRTGKYRPDADQGVDGERPDHVIDSIANLPELLELR
jgi:HAD superfamily hydrolase (TIGR01458 family)